MLITALPWRVTHTQTCCKAPLFFSYTHILTLLGAPSVNSQESGIEKNIEKRKPKTIHYNIIIIIITITTSTIIIIIIIILYNKVL